MDAIRTPSVMTQELLRKNLEDRGQKHLGQVRVFHVARPVVTIQFELKGHSHHLLTIPPRYVLDVNVRLASKKNSDAQIEPLPRANPPLTSVLYSAIVLKY